MRNIVALAMLIFLAWSTASANGMEYAKADWSSFFTTVKKEYIIGQPGMLSWNGLQDENCGCPTLGSNCFIKITIEETSVVPTGGGWHVTGVLTECFATITGSVSFSRELEHGGFVFPPGYIDIKTGDFPGVPAMHLSLAGVACGSNGEVNVVIPY